MSDRNLNPAEARAKHGHWWSNLLMLAAVALILAVVAAPLWR
jgi:hypothetical protein